MAQLAAKKQAIDDAREQKAIARAARRQSLLEREHDKAKTAWASATGHATIPELLNVLILNPPVRPSEAALPLASSPSLPYAPHGIGA